VYTWYIHEDSRTCYYYIYMKFSCICSMLIGKALVWGSFFDSTEITHSSVIIARCRAHIRYRRFQLKKQGEVGFVPAFSHSFLPKPTSLLLKPKSPMANMCVLLLLNSCVISVLTRIPPMCRRPPYEGPAP
jgi:hypothetical protein